MQITCLHKVSGQISSNLHMFRKHIIHIKLSEIQNERDQAHYTTILHCAVILEVHACRLDQYYMVSTLGAVEVMPFQHILAFVMHVGDSAMYGHLN